MKQKSSSYMDRAMKHRDPRYARVLGKLGHYPSVAVTDNLETVPAPAGRSHQVDAGNRRAERDMEASAVPAMTTGNRFTVPDDAASEATDARAPVEAPQAQPKRETAPVKPAEAEKPATPKKRGRPPKVTSEKKSTTTRRYKRRDMKAED